MEELYCLISPDNCEPRIIHGRKSLILAFKTSLYNQENGIKPRIFAIPSWQEIKEEDIQILVQGM